MSLTILTLLATAAVSIWALRDRSIFLKLDFQPYLIESNKEWYRFISHAFIHADGFHLGVNMYVLYTFGHTVESNFKLLYGNQMWPAYFVLLYLGGILFSAIPGYARNKENYSYHGVGASGAVSAVVFSYILMNPMSRLGLFFIPVGLPAFVFGLLYLAYEIYLDKNRKSNIAHSAHYIGAIFGLIFTAATKPTLIMRFFE